MPKLPRKPLDIPDTIGYNSCRVRRETPDTQRRDEMDKQELERQVNEFATRIIPADFVDSFIALDLKAKLAGIALFARAAGLDYITNAAITACKSLSN
jgi:hypothetical protein